jgi:hypothetical protein
MKNDGCSLIGLQPPEAPIQLIVVIDQSDVIASRRIESSHSHLRGLTYPAPSLVGAGVHDQPMEPCLPALWIAQVRQALPRSDQGILNGVLGLMGVTKHEPGNPIQSINGCGCKDFERPVVAAASGFDEIALQR